MNKRPFLFGLGVGIIVGAALLQLMLIGEKQASRLDDFDKGTKTSVMYTQAELDKRIAGERERIQTEALKQTKTNQDAVKQDKTNKKVQQEKSTSTKERRIVLRIPANSSVTGTAELLFKNNIIHDKQAFVDLMRKVIIRAGYFAFEGSPTLQQVKTIITGKPIPPAQAEAELERNDE